MEKEETKEKICKFFETEEGKNIIKAGFRAADIIQAIDKGRLGENVTLDPYL